MTREEAISHIKVMIESLENGIKALESNEEWEGIIPSIKPKMGRWIVTNEKDELYTNVCVCSECNHSDVGGGNYCRWCGADMRGDANMCTG